MRIKWYGHACFELESRDGVKVITDPFDEQVGYEVPRVEADIVTVSHRHYDHDNIGAISGNHATIKELSGYRMDGISIKGIGTYHDAEEGKQRGSNNVYIIEMDGIKFCHLGDLGHILNETDLEKFKNIDILLIPVGGTYTIDSSQAFEVVNSISPKLVIPMHYQTDKLKFSLEPVENFLKRFEEVTYLDSNTLEVNEEILSGERKVIVLNYE